MKKISLFIIATALCTVATAQTTDSVMTQSVNIEKEYTPEVVKVKRADIELPATEPKVEKSEVKYSSETAPMAVESQFYPLPAADAKNTGRPNYKPGYARVAIGFPLVWMADVWTPVVNNKNDFLGMTLNHNGFWNGNKKLIDTDFELDYKHHFNTGMLYSKIGFNNDYYSYYGEDTIFNKSTYFDEEKGKDFSGLGLQPEMRTTTAAHVLLGFGSEKERKNWTYDGNLRYDIMTSSPTITRDGIKLRQAAQREHRIALNLMGGYNIDGHHINADLGVEAYLHNNPARTLYLIADSIAGSQVNHTLRDTTFTNADNKPQILITFNPRYEKQWNSLSLRAGAKLWFSVNKGKVVSAAPDMEVRYTFRQLFSVYGGIGGDYAVTSISNMLDENRYMNLDSMPTLNDYTPADFHAGFDITPVSGLQIGASVSYKMIQNTHFFVNTEFACTETPNVYPKNDLDYVYGNTFNLVYAKATLLQAEAHIDYNLKERYTFHASGRYNGWNVKDENVEAWNKPTWEADASIEALFTKNFAGNVRFYYASERKAPLINVDGNSYDVKTLAPIYDLNLSLSYTFPKNISIFVQANNLLAISEKLRYQNWYGYDNIGTHVMAGISVSF